MEFSRPPPVCPGTRNLSGNFQRLIYRLTRRVGRKGRRSERLAPTSIIVIVIILIRFLFYRRRISIANDAGRMHCRRKPPELFHCCGGIKR